jgi:hypothetical protein
MPPGFGHALDDQVQGIGSIGTEDHPIRVIAPEELAESLAGGGNQILGFQSEVVASPAGRNPFSCIKVDHALKNFPGLGESGSGIIQINKL